VDAAGGRAGVQGRGTIPATRGHRLARPARPPAVRTGGLRRDPALQNRRPRRHEIPLDAIKGTTEPNRAAQFDHEFRPTRLTRCRWLSVWAANHRGTTLPPISVVPVGDGYAIRDGHHRVSVAKALGALMIRAVVAA
jgi:hypothetical protein